VPHSDWRKKSIAQKGKFGKYKKILFTETVMNFQKLKPAPNAYENFDYKKNKPLGATKL